MPRKKSGAAISPYLSAKTDGKEKRFIQTGNSLLLSKRFQELSVGARYLYFCMAMESGGRREFQFPQSAAEKYGIASTSLRRYISELRNSRFILVHSGKIQRQPNHYEFTVSWKAPAPAGSATSPGYI